MSFEVKISPEARTDIACRALEIQRAIHNTLGGDLTTSPEDVGVALRGPLSDCRSLRRGSYRIVYKVMPGEVRVLRVYKKA